jgi:hypothetical protein
MRSYFVVLIGLIATSLWAQDSLRYQPIFMNPAKLRAAQSAFKASSPRLGPFGLSQPAAARFGWDRVQRDSAYAFAAAQTLWLDYLCLFEDSLCADLALIRSPRSVWAEVGIPDRFDRTIVGEVSALPFIALPGSFEPKLPAISKPSSPDSAAPLKITVRPGDSFYRIISRHPGVKLEQLYAANKGSDRIYPGQILVIP